MSTAGTSVEAKSKGKAMMENRDMQGLAVRHHVVDFALLIGGAVATACAVAAVAMGVVLLLAH